jgi:amidophosphoribosyltransferase
MAELRDLEHWVAAQIGADSVKYNSLEAFVTALGLSRNHLCLKCWDGRRPTEN